MIRTKRWLGRLHGRVGEAFEYAVVEVVAESLTTVQYGADALHEVLVGKVLVERHHRDVPVTAHRDRIGGCENRSSSRSGLCSTPSRMASARLRVFQVLPVPGGP